MYVGLWSEIVKISVNRDCDYVETSFGFCDLIFDCFNATDVAD